jgi:hypothetical protein
VTELALALGAVLAALCVLYVARPFVREPATRMDRLPEPDELERRRVALIEERDRALDALREIEFDHRTGKLSEDDYLRRRDRLEAEARGALTELETLEYGGS